MFRISSVYSDSGLVDLVRLCSALQVSISEFSQALGLYEDTLRDPEQVETIRTEQRLRDALLISVRASA